MLNPSLRQYWAVVPAAGIGKRFHHQQPKQYCCIAGKTIAEHTLSTLLAQPWLAGLVFVVHPDDTYWPTLSLLQDQRVHVIEGGAERCHSVLNGLYALSAKAADNDWVLVHDVARPCVRASDLEHLKQCVQDHPVGGLLAYPVRDTLKQADAHQQVLSTPDRHGLWHALTPQMFPLASLTRALQQSLDADVWPTDEACAIERTGQKPLLVRGHADNIKITYPEDLLWAECMLQTISRCAP